jgi:hypothetical protein
MKRPGKQKQKQKPKRGRPATYEKPRISIAARLQAPLHARIKADADASGRSISEQCENLIQYALDRKSLLEGLKLLYGPELAGVLIILGDISKEAALNAGLLKTTRISQNLWMTDPWVFAKMKDATLEALDRIGPSGVASAPPGTVTLLVGDPPVDIGGDPEQSGKIIARNYLRELSESEDAGHSSHVLMLRDMLGPQLLARFENGKTL